MRRLLTMLVAACLAFVLAPSGNADFTPWFAPNVGNATQVLSVVGTGGSDAKLDVWQRSASGWQPVAAAIPAKIGVNGMATDHYEGSGKTPMGIFSLDFAFGTDPNPGGGLRYVQVTPKHWWDGDSQSPTYNTMQVCAEDQCPFGIGSGTGTENLDIPAYQHAVVMGVNKQRVPNAGSAFFVHGTDGGPTAGCVAIDDGKLVEIMRWLKPGAMIAIAKQQ